MSDCRPGYGYDGCQCATCRSAMTVKPTCMSHDKTHCPICADMDTYAPYRKPLEEQYENFRYYRHGGAMDGGQDERTMCVAIANALLNFMRHEIEKEKAAERDNSRLLQVSSSKGLSK
jgi:hypothetical protein